MYNNIPILNEKRSEGNINNNKIYQIKVKLY